MTYLKNRLAERSTWIGAGAAVSAAAALPSPYSWVVAAIGVVAMLCPEPGQ